MRLVQWVVCALVVAACALASGEELPDNSLQVMSCNERIVKYGTADKFFPSQILIERIAPEEFLGLESLPALATKSPQSTKWYVLEEPDFTREGPWNTTLTSRAQSKEHGANFRMKFLGHASYGVRPQWLNDKLIFVEVWWGRIVATDLIVNVENGEVLYVENADLIQFLQPCK